MSASEAHQEALEFANGLIGFMEVAYDYAKDGQPPKVDTNPGQGKYPGPVGLTFRSSEPATIYYTLDGSKPTTGSTLYKASGIREDGGDPRSARPRPSVGSASTPPATRRRSSPRSSRSAEADRERSPPAGSAPGAHVRRRRGGRPTRARRAGVRAPRDRAPGRAWRSASLPPEDRGAGGAMNQTFQNSAQVFSIGIFFTLMIFGLASTLPATLSTGLQAHGVDPATAHAVADLPPISILFAAFLGYNPIQHLIGPHVLAALPAHQQAALTGHSFFPALVLGPFRDGLHVAFAFAIVACLLAATASFLRGRPQARDAAAPALQGASP